MNSSPVSGVLSMLAIMLAATTLAPQANSAGSGIRVGRAGQEFHWLGRLPAGTAREVAAARAAKAASPNSQAKKYKVFGVSSTGCMLAGVLA
jgi:hypothetical protein